MNDIDTKKSLKDNVFDEIETKNVCPKSRWFFGCRECLFWTLWFMSVFVGALAVAVCYYVLDHGQFFLHEATHANFVTFLFETLPYLWIVVFGTMLLIAIYNIKYTKRGYKYPLWQIVLSSIALSLIGGSALNALGFGYKVDATLGKNMPQYMSQEKLERKLWLSPENGRLLGRQLESTNEPMHMVIFEDVTGNRWAMITEELHERDRELLNSQGNVRVIGEAVPGMPEHFHACGVFPWVLDNKMPREELNKERKAFIDRVYNHMLQVEERAELLEEETYATTSPETMMRCAEIAMVKKLEAKIRKAR